MHRNSHWPNSFLLYNSLACPHTHRASQFPLCTIPKVNSNYNLWHSCAANQKFWSRFKLIEHRVLQRIKYKPLKQGRNPLDIFVIVPQRKKLVPGEQTEPQKEKSPHVLGASFPLPLWLSWHSSPFEVVPLLPAEVSLLPGVDNTEGINRRALLNRHLIIIIFYFSL